MLTSREIKDILRQERIFISKRRGQNFLVDERVEKRIIQAIDIKPTDEVLEIGPGLGALTEDLAREAKLVIAVEKDRALVKILREKLSGYSNLKIICADILAEDISKFARRKLKVVGNLPYYITAPIVGYLLEKQRQNINDIFITVQYEVGQRFAAKKDSKDYSAITLLVQYFTKPELLFSIPKRAFYPQPKVDSVFLHLAILEKPRVKVNSPEEFFKVIRKCFSQRRKIILNSLAHKLSKIEKNKIQQALQAAGIDFQRRPENLSIEEFAKIENVFQKKGIGL